LLQERKPHIRLVATHGGDAADPDPLALRHRLPTGRAPDGCLKIALVLHVRLARSRRAVVTLAGA
jgi:hypothetical protein